MSRPTAVTKEIRSWALSRGADLHTRAPLPLEVLLAWNKTFPDRAVPIPKHDYGFDRGSAKHLDACVRGGHSRWGTHP